VRAWLESNKQHFRKVDLDVATFVLVTSVEAVTHMSALEGAEVDRRALPAELTELVMRYLAPSI
jgi:hypothetical protein